MKTRKALKQVATLNLLLKNGPMAFQTIEKQGPFSGVMSANGCLNKLIIKGKIHTYKGIYALKEVPISDECVKILVFNRRLINLKNNIKQLKFSLSNFRNKVKEMTNTEKEFVKSLVGLNYDEAKKATQEWCVKNNITTEKIVSNVDWYNLYSYVNHIERNKIELKKKVAKYRKMIL